MLAFIEIVLALIGLVVLIVLAIDSLSDSKPSAPAEQDLAALYRDGLQTAARLQQAAQAAEQQLYAEALAHREQQSRRAGGAW